MPAIREELYLADKFSGTFKNFDAAANASIDTAKAFQDALNDFTSGFMDGLQQSLNASRDELADMVGETEQAAQAQDRLANGASETGRAVKDAEKSQKNYTEEVNRSEQAAGSLVKTVSKIAGAIGVAKLTKDFIETADEMAQITAKLNLINDGFMTTEQLQSAIYNSAQRTRSSYMDTAQLVARIGMNTGDTFRNNTEIVKFAENLNKSFKIAGASAQEQSSVILQLSQALAGGLLRGQEFNAVMSGAPNIIKNIANYMGVTVGEMRDLAAEGQITSDIIREAMLGATDDINGQFETLPQTFSDTMTVAKNQITNALNGVFEEWITTLNDGDVQGTINDITDAISDLAKVAGNAFIDIVKGIGWIGENWESLEPILEAAGIAIIGYKALNVAQALEVKKAWLEAHGAISDVFALVGLAYLVKEQAENEVKKVETVFDIQAKRNGFDNFADMEKHADNVHDTVIKAGGGIIDSSLHELQQAKTASWYNDYYGSRYTPNDEGFAAVVQASRDRDALYAMYVQENWARRDEEAERAKTLEAIKNDGVKVKGEVKLADEDLKMFRDIAEGRYMTNVNLETLAPNISVSVEGGASLSADEIAAAVAQVIVEQRAERTAIAH